MQPSVTTFLPWSGPMTKQQSMTASVSFLSTWTSLVCRWPIRLISGNSPFCETLFEDATASATDIIGPVNQGWTVGKRLLQYERSTHAGINISGTQGGVDDTPLTEIVSDLLPTDDASGRILDNAQRSALLQWQMRQRTYEMTQRRAMEEAKARAPGFTSSAVKLTGTLLKQSAMSCIYRPLASTAFTGKATRCPRTRSSNPHMAASKVADHCRRHRRGTTQHYSQAGIGSAGLVRQANQT